MVVNSRPAEAMALAAAFLVAVAAGLGLALVQKIVVTHNGRVAVGRSALGGAAFSMTLPLEPPASTPVT